MRRRIRARIVEPKDLGKVEVESEEELEKIASDLDSPILLCERDGYIGVFDGRNKVLYYWPIKKAK